MVLALADLAWRLNEYNTARVTPGAIATLTVIVAVLVSVGAAVGVTPVTGGGQPGPGLVAVAI